MQIQFKDYKTEKEIFAYNANFVPLVGDFVEFDSIIYIVKERCASYPNINFSYGNKGCLYRVYISPVENNTHANLYY